MGWAVQNYDFPIILLTLNTSREEKFRGKRVLKSGCVIIKAYVVRDRMRNECRRSKPVSLLQHTYPEQQHK